MDKKEKLDTRFQDSSDQSVEKVEGTEAFTGSNSYNVTETKRTGGRLKQEVAAAVVAQGKGAGFDSLTSPAAYGKIAGSYSGEGRNVLGNMANTPSLPGETQGRTREGKKLSDPNKDINNMASEQYATFFQQPPALAQDREATVGYNGNPSNISARSQKNSGHTPAELLYDRSIDEIRVDHAIFTTGQNINCSASDYPRYTGTKVQYEDPDTLKEYFYPRGVPFEKGKELKRGNFMPHSIVAKFKRSNTGVAFLSSFNVEESDLSISNARPEVVNGSSAYETINVNRAELVRQTIDAAHGSPTSPDYNPLGRSVLEPTATMLYLMDIEANTGAIMTSALRHALKSKAYFLTRTGKDGLTQEAVAIDALYGHLIGAADSDDTITKFNRYTNRHALYGAYFNRELNKLGSAAVLINTFDSANKYKTKADLVNQPRGLKLPLSTGLNNYKPFHVDSEFVDALNSIDVFSTIDREYDPSAPTMIHDGMAYIMPYSWKRSLSFTRDGLGKPRKYTSEVFTYSYQAGNGNQRYYVKVGEPVLNGIAWFLEQYAESICDALQEINGEFVLNIPVRSYGTRFSLFDYIIAASSSYILYERTNSFKDILDEEVKSGYPFGHLHAITEGDIDSPTNYGKIDQFSRLSTREMKPATAMRWIMPELFTPMGEKKYLYPWYYAESDFYSDGTNLIRHDHSHFPAPVIRSGVALSLLDKFYDMSLKDQMLCIDMMTTLPGNEGLGAEATEGYFYKYGLDSEGLIIGDADTGDFVRYLSTPRQMGWVLVAPFGLCRIPAKTFLADSVGELDDKKIVEYYTEDQLKENIDPKQSSYVVRAYRGAYGSVPGDILSHEVVSINRGQAFAQKWYQAYAASSEANSTGFDIALSYMDGFVRNSGNDINDIKISNAIAFKPYSVGEDGRDTTPGPVIALMNVLWARIQKLPFIINPFDAGSYAEGKGVIDPFDFAYMFGLAGFMGVTFHEEMSNRMSDKYSRMFNFVDDPYVKDSPLFKH